MVRLRRAAPFALLASIVLVLASPPHLLAQTSDPKALLRAMEGAFVSVADRVMPSVVNVSATPKRGKGEESLQGEERFREFFGEEFFERFFRGRPPREESRAAGSGVIVDPRGYILTNNHVIENADTVTVRLSDQRKFTAKVIGRDSKTDLAVIKVEAPPSSLPVADLGDSDKLRTGQWAIAIGNPFGLDRTVTVGIISATGRQRVGVATYENFIQTDASINPGNSGGPLLNLDGKVVGINTAIVAAGQGIGFSIPINMAKEIMRQLIETGKVVRGWLGIAIQDLTDELAAGFGVPQRGGVLVADVMKGSPAEAAGLKAGDVIVEFGGQAVKEVPDLQRRVASTPPGRPSPLVIVRDRRRERVTIKIGEMPGEETVVAASQEEGWGLTVEPLTSEGAARFNLTAGDGVVVTAVAPGSEGARAGIRQGDVILEVNREPVSGVEGFRQALSKITPGQMVPVYLRRGDGGREYVVLKGPEKSPPGR